MKKKMTKRQKIFYYWLQGRSYREIALKVGCSKSTVGRTIYGDPK